MRLLEPADVAWLPQLYEAVGDPNDDVDHELPDALAHLAEHGFCHFACLSRATGEPVGVVELHLAGEGIAGIEPQEVELGWVISPERRGKGLATEGASAVAGHALEQLGHDHLVAYIRPGNPASVRVAEKIGMRVRGDGKSRSGDPVTVWELRA